MCGVVGVLNRDGAPVSPAVLRRMTDMIRHRGPDDEGYYTADGVGIGHRRLSIIDLSPAGHQPMLSQDGRWVLSYNGEIYNFHELRLELEAKGYTFRSRTDSEVVLNAWIEWGERALDRFNGMFAFAIWDMKRRELVLARDRYGVKPIYFCDLGEVFLFGSEIKAFFPHPSFCVELDRKALVEYFTFQNFFTDRTLFENVRMLSPGCLLRVSLEGGKAPVQRRYWDFHFEEPGNPASEAEYREELDRLIRQAVNRQLVSDVEIGSYLSGGMDSGTLTALAAMQLPFIKTFTVGFDLSSASGIELAFDERERAEHMSYLFKTEHYEMVLKAGDMERCMSDLVWHLEEPRVGQSYPNFYAAKLASKFTKVVLAGTGGDELFGGYPWRYYRAVVNTDFEDYVDKYYLYWQRLIPNRDIKRVFAPIWEDVGELRTRDIMRDVFTNHAAELKGPETYINHSLYLEAKTFLHGLLVVDDKLSMTHSLETRVPLLDNDLVDFAMNLPVAHKLCNFEEVLRINENESGRKPHKYYQKTSDGKLLLRHVMGGYIPERIARAHKQGFSAPDASWFRGESIDYVRRTLYANNARIYDYLDRGAVHALVDEHLEGKQNRRLLIWSLLNLEQWCRIFLDGEPPGDGEKFAGAVPQ